VSDLFIPKALAGRCRLIKLQGYKKKPEQNTWGLKNSYDPSDPEIIEHVHLGNNYAIMPINGAILIDCDTEKLYDSLPEAWRQSLTVRTGREEGIGRHVFLYCPDSPSDKFVLKDGDEPLGDVRGSFSDTYSVGAGSIHPDSKRKYYYENPDAPLIEISWSEIKEHLLDKYKIKIAVSIPKITRPSNNGGISSKLGLRIEDFTRPINAKRMASGDIQGEHPIHGSKTGMNFSINTQKNTWFCYRCRIGGDPVSWIAYEHCGVDESQCDNLSHEDILKVKKWLSENGYKKQIESMDAEYFAPDPSLPQPDITLITKPSVSDIDKEIQAAKERSLLPAFPELDDGIFKDYIDFGKRVSYSLEEYHFAALLSVASMAIGRKAVIKVGMTSIYPNVFVMVVGQTTISGKSVACNIAIDSFSKSFVHEEPIAKCNSTNILRGTISEAALIQGLHEVYNSLWYYDDCAGFFEDVTAWNAHVLGTLCSIYDGSAVERTLSKRSKSGEQFKWVCPTPFVSLLFNTTTKDIEQIASARLFSSGFFPRLMWFYGQGGQPRRNRDITDDDKAFVKEIGYKIKQIREKLSPLQNDSIQFGISDIIEEWKINATLHRLTKEDEAYRTAVSRGFIHAYKIATILALFDQSFDLISDCELRTIPEKHALMAIRIVEQYLIPRMMYVYDLCNSTDNKNHQVQVMKALTHFGGSAERSKLLRYTHMNSKDIGIAIQTLQESNEIKIYTTKTGDAKKSTSIIIKV